MENTLLNTNTIKIVGKLVDAKVTTGNRKDNGQGYISVDATVVSLINGVSNEFKVNFYTNQLTKDGKQSKLYDSYNKLPEMVGKNIKDIENELKNKGLECEIESVFDENIDKTKIHIDRETSNGR